MKKKTIFILFVFAAIFVPKVIAAIEGTYTETDTAVERDENGVILNATEDAHRDIPDNRNIYRIGTTNVIKAEEKDKYTHRMINEMKKTMEDTLNKFDARLSAMEVIARQLKSEMKYRFPERKASLKKISTSTTTTEAAATGTNT